MSRNLVLLWNSQTEAELERQHLRGWIILSWRGWIILRLQNSLKVAFCVEFGETTCNISCIELFQLFLFDLFVAKSWKFVNVANKPNLQWGLNILGYDCIPLGHTPWAKTKQTHNTFFADFLHVININI